jgi:hypothetical protein
LQIEEMVKKLDIVLARLDVIDSRFRRMSKGDQVMAENVCLKQKVHNISAELDRTRQDYALCLSGALRVTPELELELSLGPGNQVAGSASHALPLTAMGAVVNSLHSSSCKTRFMMDSTDNYST